MNPRQLIRKIIVAVAGMAQTANEWVGLRLSYLERIDGVAICDFTMAQTSKDFLNLTCQAMALIKSHDARRYRRVCRYLHYIANRTLISQGQYGQALKVCRVDHSMYFNSHDQQRNIREYAGLLIHEATHGLLFGKNIPYNKETRERIERLCHLEEYRFALHFEAGYADLFPGPYNPEGHRESWERSSQARRAVWWKRIREAYQEYRSSNPKNARDFSLRGGAYLQRRDYDKAIADCDQAIRLDPQLAAACNIRGTAYVQKHEYDKAILNYHRAIELNPGEALVYMNLGIAYIGKRLCDKAIAAFNQAIQLNPTDARIRMNRGTAYLWKRDYDNAISDYDYAIQLDPKNARIRMNRGKAYLWKRDYDNAISDYDYAIQLDPKNPQIRINRGKAYMWKRNYDIAISDYDYAIRLNPKDATSHENLAWLLATCPQVAFRDGKKAVEHAMQACALSEGKVPDALKTLAAAYGEMGDFENAVKWECQFLGTPDQIAKARLNAESRLSLYQAHKTLLL